MGISVVIPARRAARLITRAVMSVRENARCEVEIIVVVDGGEDNTAEVADHLPCDRIIVNSDPQGAPAARNRGLAKTRQEFVHFLDADDYIEGNLHAAALETFEASAAHVVFGPWCREHSDGTREAARRFPDDDARKILLNWLKGEFTPPCSVFWRREWLLSVGGWTEKLRRDQDGELIYRSLIKGAKCALSTEGLGIYVDHASPHRLTKPSAEAFRSLLDVAERVLIEAKRHERWDHELACALQHYAYWSARAAYANGYDLEGDALLSFWRQLGGTEHIGDIKHRMAARVLGLKNREKLGRAARAIGSIFRAVKPMYGGRGRDRRGTSVQLGRIPSDRSTFDRRL